MRTQEVAGCHRMRAEVVAPAQWHAGNTLEERLEFGALERHAKLEVGEGIRTRLESGRRSHHLPKPEEAILVVGAQPVFLLHRALDRRSEERRAGKECRW